MVELKSKQHIDPLLMELMESVLNNLNELFSQGDGVLMYQVKLCVPDVDDFEKTIFIS